MACLSKWLINSTATALFSLMFFGVANATTINFGSSGYTHDQTLTGDEYLSQGLQILSGDRIMTPCGGACVSADSVDQGWAYGDSVFNFVLPGTTENASVNSLSFDSVIGNLEYSIFDAAGNLFASGFGDYSYTGETEISFFSVSYNYDGIYSISWDSLQKVDVPAPASIALLAIGLLAMRLGRKTA